MNATTTLERPVVEPTTTPTPIRSPLRYVAAGLAFASELIHLWQVPDEFITWPLRGIFFLLVSIGLGALSVNLLFDPRRWTIRLGVALNAYIIAVWTFTRLVGVPNWISFDQQPVNAQGVVAMAISAVLIGTLAVLGRRR